MSEKANTGQYQLKKEEEFLKKFSLRKFTVPTERLSDRSNFLNQPKSIAMSSDRSDQKRFRIEYKELKKALKTNVPWWLRATGLEVDMNTDRLAVLVEEPQQNVCPSKCLVPFIKEQHELKATQTFLKPEKFLLAESLQEDILTIENLTSKAGKSPGITDKCDLCNTACIERRLSEVLRMLNSLEYVRLDSGCDRCHGQCVSNEQKAIEKASPAAISKACTQGGEMSLACPQQNLCICDLEDVDMEIEYLCSCLGKLLELQCAEKLHYKDIIHRLGKIRKSLNEFIKKATSSDLAFVPEKLEKIEYFCEPEKMRAKIENAKAELRKSPSKKENKSSDSKKCKGRGCCGFGGKPRSNSSAVEDDPCLDLALMRGGASQSHKSYGNIKSYDFKNSGGRCCCDVGGKAGADSSAVNNVGDNQCLDSDENEYNTDKQTDCCCICCPYSAPMQGGASQHHKGSPDPKNSKRRCYCAFEGNSGKDSAKVYGREDRQRLDSAENKNSTDKQKACCVCCKDNIPMYIPCVVLNQPPSEQATTFDLEACLAETNEVALKSKKAGNNQQGIVKDSSNDRKFCSDLVNCLGIGQYNKNENLKASNFSNTATNAYGYPAGNTDLNSKVLVQPTHDRVKAVDQGEECQCPCVNNQNTMRNAEEKSSRGQRDYKSSSNRENCEDTGKNQTNQKMTSQAHSKVDQQNCETSQRESIVYCYPEDNADLNCEKLNQPTHARVKTIDEGEECQCPCVSNQNAVRNAEDPYGCKDSVRKTSEKSSRGERDHKGASNRENCEDTGVHQPNQRMTNQAHAKVDQQNCETFQKESMKQECRQTKYENKISFKKENTNISGASHCDPGPSVQTNQLMKTERVATTDNKQTDCTPTQKHGGTEKPNKLYFYKKTERKEEKIYKNTDDNCPEITIISRQVRKSGTAGKMVAECGEQKTDKDTYDSCPDVIPLTPFSGRQKPIATARHKQAERTRIELSNANTPCRCCENIKKPGLRNSTINLSELTIRVCHDKTGNSCKHSKKKNFAVDTGKDVFTKDFCNDCFGKDVPLVKKDLAGEIRKIIGNRKRNSVFLKFTILKSNLYHMQMCTENDYLGCLYATEAATFEARDANGFDGYITLTVTDTLNTLSQIESLVDHAFMVVQQEKRNSC